MKAAPSGVSYNAAGVQRAVFFLTAASFFAFFIFGFSDNLKGATLPALLADLKLNYSLGGTILFGAYMGFLAATLFTGVLSDYAGKKAPLLVAAVCLGLGILGYSSGSSAWLLTISMVVFGMGLGSIELGANATIVDLHPQRKGLLLNLMAVFHGIGSMIAPLYAGWMLQIGQSWRVVYRWDWLLAVLLFAFFLLARYPSLDSEQPKEAEKKPVGQDRAKHLLRTAFTGEMILFYLAIGAYVAVEIGVASWIVEFLQKTRDQSVSASTAALSLFFLMVTVGRLVGSFLVEKIGYLRAVLGAMIGAGVFITLGSYGGSALSFFLPLSGIFISIVFPTITAEVSSRRQENMGTVLGLLFAFAGIGGMLGPWLMGLASDWLGIYWGFGVSLVFCVMVVAAVVALISLKKHDTSLNYGK